MSVSNSSTTRNPNKYFDLRQIEFCLLSTDVTVYTAHEFSLRFLLNARFSRLIIKYSGLV